MEGISVIDEPRVKSRNLNVVAEFEKSGMKRLANFVVVGKQALQLTCSLRVFQPVHKEC